MAVDRFLGRLFRFRLFANVEPELPGGPEDTLSSLIESSSQGNQSSSNSSNASSTSGSSDVSKRKFTRNSKCGQSRISDGNTKTMSN